MTNHSETALDLADLGERLVPARFEFTRDERFSRVRGIVLPEGTVGSIARRFQAWGKDIANLIPLPKRL